MISDPGDPDRVDITTAQPIHDYYQTLAPTYDKDRFGNSYGRYVDRLERDLLAGWLQNRPPGSVVELACGTGRLLDFAMTGVDLSSAMLAEAREKWNDRQLIHADASSTGLPSQSFDAAICFHLLMHLDVPACKAVLAEAARLVRPGGSLIFDIPSKPRRTLSGRPSSGWHGDTAASPADLQRWAGTAWRVKRRRGILIFPIHRLPSNWRSRLARFDAALGRTPLGRWGSYYVCELVRT